MLQSILGRMRLKWFAPMLAATIGIAVLAPTAAHATDATIGSPLQNLCTGCWTNYTTTRSATGIAIQFTPSDLIYQGGPAYALNLRLNNTSNSPITGSVTWTQVDWWRTLHSNPAANLQFRIGACCYSASTGDKDWAGTLRY